MLLITARSAGLIWEMWDLYPFGHPNRNANPHSNADGNESGGSCGSASRDSSVAAVG